jgi:two-component system, OmpR family, phosphate regulon sensor histidine kinase PhoR
VRPLSVASLIADIGTKAQILARAQGNAIKVECNTALWIRANAKELYKVFLNLVSNAIRYSPAGGDIILRWYSDDEGAHFSVQDHGVGIEPQHIPRITERFYRVDKARSRASGGTGLGLAIVKHVLPRHGAALRVESKPSCDSVFTCDFPSTRVERRRAHGEAASS